MTRPNAAYVGMGLVTHPIRLVMNRGLHGNVAKLLSISEALELMTDLTDAIRRAVEQEAKKEIPPRTESTHANYPRSARAADPDFPGSAG